MRRVSSGGASDPASVSRLCGPHAHVVVELVRKRLGTTAEVTECQDLYAHAARRKLGDIVQLSDADEYGRRAECSAWRADRRATPGVRTLADSTLHPGSPNHCWRTVGAGLFCQRRARPRLG